MAIYAKEMVHYMQPTKSNIGDFLKRDGQIAGEFRIMRGWHAIGSNVSLVIIAP